MSDRTRAEQIAGIYELALWLEQNPDVPIPWDLSGTSEHTTIMIHADQGDLGEKAVMAAAARAIPGKVNKATYGPEGSELYSITGTIPGGVRVHVVAHRDEVCQRVVTGIREVTKTVPDPMVAVPTIEVTETVEDVEWVCGPLLREQASPADDRLAVGS